MCVYETTAMRVSILCNPMKEAQSLGPVSKTPRLMQPNNTLGECQIVGLIHTEDEHGLYTALWAFTLSDNGDT